MSSELARAAVRISTNYARLIFMITMGIALVPIILSGSTAIGFGLWGLLGATAGFGDMFKEIVKTSMNRELGEAYHRGDNKHFIRVFNSALVVTIAATAFGILIYIAIYAALPLFNIEDGWMKSARTIVIFQGLASAFAILTAPLFNLYLASERMAVYNFFLVAERASYILSAIFWIILYPAQDPQVNLVRFAITGSLLAVSVVGIAALTMIFLDRRTIPRLSMSSMEHIKQIVHTSGWNGVMSAALNLHIRLDQLLINLWFGLAGNAVFVAAVRLASYVRMITLGMTDGLDVVAARLSSQNKSDRLNDLLPRITKLHAIIAIPAASVVIVYAPAILNLWIGSHLNELQLSMSITTVRIIAIGMAARSISDGWISSLYGAGYVRRYAPMILAGGVLNPIIAFALYKLLPDNRVPGTVISSFNAAAISFTSIFVGVHLMGMPRIVKSCLGISVLTLVRPILKPALVGGLVVMSGAIFIRVMPINSVAILAIHAISIAAWAGLLTLLIVPDSNDRALIKRAVSSIKARVRPSPDQQ